jgi:hypothetical protein
MEEGGEVGRRGEGLSIFQKEEDICILTRTTI